MIDGADRGAGGQARDVVRVRRREGIRVERHGASGGLPDQREVLGVVDAGDLGVGRRPRLLDRAALLPELGGHDLHHLESLDPLGMTGRRQMIGEEGRREEGQRHDENSTVNDDASFSGRWPSRVMVIVGRVGMVMPAIAGPHADLRRTPGRRRLGRGFTRVGVWTLVVIGMIAFASYGVDFVAAALGAKHLGASPRAMTGAALGTLPGSSSVCPA